MWIYITNIIFWFLNSIGFNTCTPRLLHGIIRAGGFNLDATVIELTMTCLIGCMTLIATRRRLFPPIQHLGWIFIIGTLDVINVRLFMYGLQRIPISLSQTIRASNPVGVVFVGGVFFRHRYSITKIISLIPIIFGFSLAVGFDTGVSIDGVAAAVGSMLCCVCVNNLCKPFLDNPKVQSSVHSSEMQLWTNSVTLLLLIPLWLNNGGSSRIWLVYEESSHGVPLLAIACLDGIFFYAEQVAELNAIKWLGELSFAVLDTLRRLWIVIVAGFCLQGNVITWYNVFGILLVCAGAMRYSYINSIESAGKPDKLCEELAPKIQSKKTSKKKTD